MTEPVVALDGRNHLGTDHGNLGTSANAKAPLRAPDGAIIGEVSAGILERRVSDQLLSELPTLLLYFAFALGDRPGRLAHAGAAAEAEHLRTRARRDRRAGPGARGDASRYPRGRDHARPDGRRHAGQRRGPAAARLDAGAVGVQLDDLLAAGPAARPAHRRAAAGTTRSC